MEILIQSILARAKSLNYPLHVRYSERIKKRPRGNPEEHHVTSSGAGAQTGEPCGTSYVIISKDYSYLEPVIRSMFDRAEDVMIIVDRRTSTLRNDAYVTERQVDRRFVPERRVSVPMLDILISVGD